MRESLENLPVEPDAAHAPNPALNPEPDAASPLLIERPTLIRNRRGLWRDVLEMVVLIVIIYTLVNLTTARALVLGASMQPNFYTGQLIIVNRFAYYFTNPARGDVVVLLNPTEQCKDVIRQNTGLSVLVPQNKSDMCDDLIKRVIGLPGETVQIQAGRVSINGKLIEEPYIPRFCERGCDNTWKLKDDQYFVLGDNRPNSLDIHSFGPINRSLIDVEAWVRYWPLQDFGVLPHPDYGTIPTATP